MAAIERDNPSLKGVLPKDYAQLREQQAEGAKLDASIAVNLKELGFGD